MKSTARFPLSLSVLLVTLLTACASATPQNHYDPLEKMNRVTDAFNTKLDNVTLKPLAITYRDLTPQFLRTGVSNFFDNIAYMDTVLNDFLQGKGRQGMHDFGRFLANTTLGIGGLIDVATPMGLQRHNEDFGQTLAVWGASQGAYIVYPVLGPSSVRDTPGIAVSTATNGLFWAGLFMAPQVTIPVTVLRYVDLRTRLLSATKMRDELALDPYVFTREAWHQNREYLIYDGNPPPPPGMPDDNWQDDSFDSK
ncbi:MAG TPA: VacJ family lipoprotein [Mariprofundaceae bacterium]|nr:VacJ family lipoprotein [Mariprofundaceae bacterium]